MTSLKPTKVLIPVDGSQNAERAVTFAIDLIRRGIPLEPHLLNVQPPLRGDVTSFVPKSTVKEYHQEEGMKALASARARLDAAGVAHHVHIGVGPAGETIAGFARELGCEQIVMGTRGLGAAVGLILGSVATDVIRHAEVPVTLVK